MCVNQVISSHLFVEHLKHSFTQHSEGRLQRPVDEKDRLEKISNNNNDNNNEALIKREPLVCTRARRAVQKK